MALKLDMVIAANELYERYFPEWQLCNRALEALRISLPRWDENSCLIKAAAINQLYATNVYLIVPLAQSISEKILCKGPKQGPCLVELLALHPTTGDKHVSFSSKLCHFFVDAKKYCILDGAATETLKHFLGAEYISDQSNRYGAFLTNLDLIRRKSPELDSTQIDNVALDRFLWLFGLWVRFRNKQSVNAEAMRVFRSPPKEILSRMVAGCEDGM